MRKRAINAILALGAVLALGVASAHAEGHYQIRVTIPFDFHVGPKTLPAGNYVISRLSQSDDSVFLIRSADCSYRTPFLTQPAPERVTPVEAVLVFNRYGGHYYLSQVVRRGDQLGHRLNTTREERSLQQDLVRGGSSGFEQVQVAASQ